MEQICASLQTLEIVLLSALIWVPAGIVIGTVTEHWRGHVRADDEFRGRQG